MRRIGTRTRPALGTLVVGAVIVLTLSSCDWANVTEWRYSPNAASGRERTRTSRSAGRTIQYSGNSARAYAVRLIVVSFSALPGDSTSTISGFGASSAGLDFSGLGGAADPKFVEPCLYGKQIGPGQPFLLRLSYLQPVIDNGKRGLTQIGIEYRGVYRLQFRLLRFCILPQRTECASQKPIRLRIMLSAFQKYPTILCSFGRVFRYERADRLVGHILHRCMMR